MPVSPYLAAKFPRLDGVTSVLDALADPVQKAKFDAYLAWAPGYDPPRVETVDAAAQGPHGPVPVRVYRPCLLQHEPPPALVWLHGGGFVAGDLDMPESDVVARELSHRASAVVVSVDYRLALGEVSFPVPHDDVVAAYRWAVGNATELAIDPRRISLGGASAGANLACGAALRLRDDHDDPSPYRLLLAYPLLHAVVPKRSGEHDAAMAEVPPVLRFPDDLVAQLVSNYLGAPVDGTTTVPAYAMPAGGDVRALPPVTIVTCEYDDLRPSGEAFARVLHEAGVEVRIVQEAGMLHGHLNEDPRIPEVDHSLSILASELR